MIRNEPMLMAPSLILPGNLLVYKSEPKVRRVLPQVESDLVNNVIKLFFFIAHK